MNRPKPTTILLVLVLLLLALALLLGPCVLTSNPVEPTPEPASADETGATTP